MSDDETYFRIDDEARRKYMEEASIQFRQLRTGNELSQQQKEFLELLQGKLKAQGPPMPKGGEVFGYQILQEIEEEIGLDWYEELTKTALPPPLPPNSLMAYWTTREGKHLSLWNPSDVIVTVFNKRILYLQEIKHLSHEDSFAQATKEFSRLKLGQEDRPCEYCGVVFNPSSGLGQELKRLDRDRFYFYLQRKTCSEQCSKTLKWLKLVKDGMLPNAEFDRSITWESVWQRFGPKCYICGQESIYDQEDLSLRMGTKVWKARWGEYRRGDPGRNAVVEHVYPRSKGGSHTWDNVRIACHNCNLQKGDSIPNGYGLGSRPQP